MRLLLSHYFRRRENTNESQQNRAGTGSACPRSDSGNAHQPSRWGAVWKQQSHRNQEAPVTIVSPLPVPVSVGNFPATQSITGTVNVANFSNQFSFRDSRRAVLLDIRQSTETIVLYLKKLIGWANGAGRRSSDIGWIGEGSTVFR